MLFTPNRDRLLRGEIARHVFPAVLAAPAVEPLLASEHVPVDGTLLDAWASMKRVRPKDGGGELPWPGRNGERDWHGGGTQCVQPQQQDASLDHRPGGAAGAWPRCANRGVTPQVAQHANGRRSAIDGCAARRARRSADRGRIGLDRPSADAPDRSYSRS